MKNKVILITGGGTGIGKACATRLIAEGAQVIIMGRRATILEAIAAEIGATAIVGNAALTSDMQKVTQLITENFGGLDGLVCNAGGFGVGDITNTNDEDWAKSLDSNLNSAFVSIRACLPLLIKNHQSDPSAHRSIVIISSIAGLGAGIKVCGYTTTKHALIGLTRSIARDYAAQGIRVNAICPGWVRTPMADEEMQILMDHYHETLDDAYLRVSQHVPLKRPAFPEEIANICRFLISNESSIMTGTVTVADGGATIVDVPTLAFTEL